MSNFVPDFPYLKKKKEIKKKVTLLILAELQIHKKLTRMVQRFFFLSIPAHQGYIHECGMFEVNQ